MEKKSSRRFKARTRNWKPSHRKPSSNLVDETMEEVDRVPLEEMPTVKIDDLLAAEYEQALAENSFELSIAEPFSEEESEQALSESEEEVTEGELSLTEKEQPHEDSSLFEKDEKVEHILAELRRDVENQERKNKRSFWMAWGTLGFCCLLVLLPVVFQPQRKSSAPGTASTTEVKTKAESEGKKKDETVAVPDVVGASEVTARQLLETQGLVVTVKKEYSTDVEKGTVIGTSSPAGTKKKKGDTVTIYVSKGKENVSLPNVVGKSESEATRLLEEKGFVVYTEFEYSSSTAEGKVISQSPSGGNLEKGSSVTITVSLGKEEKEEEDDEDEYEYKTPASSYTSPSSSRVQMATVPDLMDYTQEEATSYLKELGFFTVSIVYESSTTVEKGYVIKVAPGAGSSIPTDQLIALTISSGS